MKRILISLSVIGAAAAIVFGATTAFFSDTEQSTGNTFTAGSLDLIFRDVSGTPLPVSGPLFNLTDMKPGDKGEKTVDLVVDSNPACGKVSINVTSDLDNTCTEPESLVDPEGLTCGKAGELNDAVNFLVWEDTGIGDKGIACDNVMNGDESTLVSGPLTGEKAYSIGELPTTEKGPKCYGIAYCFGSWNGATCDGASVNNASQTDSFTADLIIDALQKRNQFPNGCPAVGDWPTPTVLP